MCEPVRYTACPVGSAKYRGFVGCTSKGPVAGLDWAKRCDGPKTTVRHRMTIDIKIILAPDCIVVTPFLVGTTPSTIGFAFNLVVIEYERLVTERSVCMACFICICCVRPTALASPIWVASYDVT